MRRSFMASILTAVLCVMSVSADVPQMINYQGLLTNAGGDPVADGSYSVVFTIYDDAVAGSSVWVEAQSVTTADGRFSVLLGSVNPILDTVFNGTTRYLGITVGGDAELSPRTALVSVPYANRVSTVDGASGGDIDSDLTVNSTDLLVFKAEYTGGGDVDAAAVHGVSRPNDFWGIGGRFEANYLGVDAEVYPGGTNSSYTYLAVSAKVDGGNANNFGLMARAQNCAQATGVDGVAKNGTEFATGVYGRVSVNSSTSTGVMGSATTAGDFNYGVHGLAQGTGLWNYGSHGQASGASTGNIGVSASALGNSGWKRAINASTYGTGTNYAIYAWSEDNTATSNYGIYASASGASTNWAGYFNGDVNITGTLTGGKSGMRIDHPDDPENKYLQHSNIVSPDMMTVYNGIVVTDRDGHATVMLPDYFGSLNGDFRYQLTAIGSFSQAIVFDEITNNQFVIATDQPAVKVSWQVTGVRKDPVATTQRIETELVKSAEERGKYQNPLAFGLSRDHGINQVEEPARNEQHAELAKRQSASGDLKKK